MRSITKEEKIGAKISLTILLSGILAIILIVAIISGGIQYLLFLPFDYSFAVLLIATVFWGSRAGVQILRENKHDDWTGIKTAFLIFLTFFVSRIPLDMDFRNLFNDTWAFKNFLMAFSWIIATWTIPTIVYGVLIGRRIKKYVR